MLGDSRSLSSLSVLLFSALGDMGVKKCKMLAILCIWILDIVGNNGCYFLILPFVASPQILLLALLYVCRLVKQPWMYRESQLIHNARGAKVIYIYIFILIIYECWCVVMYGIFFLIEVGDLPKVIRECMVRILQCIVLKPFIPKLFFFDLSFF